MVMIITGDVTIQRFCCDTISQHSEYPRYDTIQTIDEAANHMVSLAVCLVSSRTEKETVQSRSSRDKTCQADPG